MHIVLFSLFIIHYTQTYYIIHLVGFMYLTHYTFFFGFLSTVCKMKYVMKYTVINSQRDISGYYIHSTSYDVLF